MYIVTHKATISAKPVTFWNKLVHHIGTNCVPCMDTSLTWDQPKVSNGCAITACSYIHGYVLH